MAIRVDEAAKLRHYQRLKRLRIFRDEKKSNKLKKPPMILPAIIRRKKKRADFRRPIVLPHQMKHGNLLVHFKELRIDRLVFKAIRIEGLEAADLGNNAARPDDLFRIGI